MQKRLSRKKPGRALFMYVYQFKSKAVNWSF